ncbi:MAG: hypothetical protein WA655_23905 [Candidatus Korobacteraceae bacterium]
MAAAKGAVSGVENNGEPSLLLQTFAPLHRTAMGIACGVVGGGLLALVSLALLSRGTDEAVTAGALLGQFLWGYSVSWPGVFIGLIWGFVVGFVLGYGFALVRNGAVWLWLTMIRSRAEMDQYSDFLDHL